MLEPLALHLGVSGSALWQELHSAHLTILEADWSEVSGAVATQDDPGPYLVGAQKGFAYGRYGVNLQRNWHPSVFVGSYLLSYDHGVPLLSPEVGGDFALILDLHRSKAFGDSYLAEEEFLGLCARLGSDSQGWEFTDYLAASRPNKWHPLYLRRPQADIFAGCTTAEHRATAYLEAARAAVKVLLAGGELDAIRDRRQRATGEAADTSAGAHLDAANAIMEHLKKTAGVWKKSDILSATGVAESDWTSAMNVTVHGSV